MINIKTLGGFGIECNEKDITLGRNKGSKYIQLVSRICISGEKGVSKETLQEDIYSDDLNAKSNLNNSMNNLIYQFKKVAEKAGLPEGRLISTVSGGYKTDPGLEVVTDAVIFEECIKKARKQSSTAKKTELYEKAFGLYKGDFLPELDDLYWVSKKAEEYRILYNECIDNLSVIYLGKEKYADMARIYHAASKIDMDCEWQVGEIDAYRLMGDYNRAYSLYEEMVRYYAEELGISPTEKMQTCYQKLQDAAFSHRKGEEENSDQAKTLGEELLSEDNGNPYECLFPEMSASYHILNRNMSRHGLTVFLMLITISDYEGKEIKQEEKAEKRMSILRGAINETLRHSDAFCRYSKTQYLILLTGTGVEECTLVHRRLQDRLKELAGPRAGLNYKIITYDDMNSNNYE